MKNFYFYLFLIVLQGCKINSQRNFENNNSYKIKKTDFQWKYELSEISYYVLRESGTEYSFTGEYNNHYESGVYNCMGCGTPLYTSEYKYDSKSGWPSFDKGFDDNLEFNKEYSLGFSITEIKCNNCGGHLGHLFNDGPKNTTGKRHCINSAALSFIPKDE